MHILKRAGGQRLPFFDSHENINVSRETLGRMEINDFKKWRLL